MEEEGRIDAKVLLLVGCVALAVALVPQAYSLFQSQHAFVSGEEVNCNKCHTESVSGPHSTMNCQKCHPSGKVNGKAHAAAAVQCMWCHATGKGGAPSVKNITSENEAHKTFYENAESATFLKGGNEACVSCHTAVGVRAKWRKPENMEFDVGVSPAGEWLVENWSTENYTTETNY